MKDYLKDDGLLFHHVEGSVARLRRNEVEKRIINLLSQLGSDVTLPFICENRLDLLSYLVCEL